MSELLMKLNMPDEVRDAGLKLNKAMRRNRKAKRQYGLWKTELELSVKELEVIQQENWEIQSRWKDDGTMELREELT